MITVTLIHHLISQYGIIAICILIFIETGLLAGLLLPGDSLLFLAGIYAANGTIPLWEVLLLTVIAAIAGDTLSYIIGEKFGEVLFVKDDGFFNKKNLEKTKAFYTKHGGKSIIIAKFISYIRAFAPTVAGMSKLSYQTFIKYDILSAFLWVWSLTFLGYFLGKKYPHIISLIDKFIFIMFIVALIVISSHIIYSSIIKKRLNTE